MNREFLIAMFSSVIWKEKLNDFLRAGGDINLITKDDGWSLVHYAIYVENHAAVNWLRSHGADINMKDYDGCTPLHCAVFCDLDMAILSDLPLEFSTTKFLLSVGADPLIKDNKGNLPRDLAGHYGVEVQHRFDQVLA